MGDSVMPPDWAIERAEKLYRIEMLKADARNSVEIFEHAFARYIAEHEEPPVDPLYEALFAVVEMGRYDTREQAELLRRELADRGLHIVEIGSAK